MTDRRPYRTEALWQQIQEQMQRTGTNPAEYTDRLQRLAAMLNQAQSNKPIKDNHPRQKP